MIGAINMIREASVMLILNKDGLILGVSRRDDSSKFGLPGGKLEVHETPMEAGIRETVEETGIKVNSCVEIYKRLEPAGSPNGFPFYTYCFYATDWEGEEKDSEEGIVKWLTVGDLIGNSGAFPEYNLLTLKAFKNLYPKINLRSITDLESL